jgi:hypothetical protein
MRTMKLVCALAMAILTGACSGAQLGDQKQEARNVIKDFRIKVADKCPSEESGEVKPSDFGLGTALIAAVLPSLIDASLDLLSGALNEVAKDRSKAVTAVTAAHLHKIAPQKDGNPPTEPTIVMGQNFGCLILVKGEFSDIRPAPNKPEVKDDVYIEAKIDFSSDGAAFRLVPILVQINNFEATGVFGGDPEIAVSVALHSARSSKESAPIALTLFALPKVKAGTNLKGAELQAAASYWTALPSPDNAAKLQLDRMKAAYNLIDEAASAETAADCKMELDDLWAAILKPDSWPISKLETSPLSKLEKCPDIQEAILRAVLETQAKKDSATETSAKLAAAATIVDFRKRALATKEIAGKLSRRQTKFYELLEKEVLLTPVSIEVQLIESRKGSPFLQAVANALDKSKKDISTALVQELSPVERAKRRAEEEQQTRTNRAAVATAEDNVRLKQAELDDLPATATRAERVRAENALRQAKIAANNAYLADGRGVPYPEVQP